MKITDAMKKWLIDNGLSKEGDSEDELRKAAAGAMIEGKLTAEKYLELSKEPDQEEADEFSKKLDIIADNLAKVAEAMQPKQEPKKEEKATQTQTKTVEGGEGKAEKMITRMGGTEGDGQEQHDVRLKRAVERYDDTKSVLAYPSNTKDGGAHPMAGQPVEELGHMMNTPSRRTKALAGVWAKFQLMSVTPRVAGNTQQAWDRLTDHEKDLLAYLVEEEEWDDSTDKMPRSVKGHPDFKSIKALVDDGGASGALEAAPIVFDDMVIQAPLLNGELYPLVNVVPLARGRRVEGVATGTVTGSWGGVDDTAITLFTTTSYITAFDTTVYRWQGAIKIGLDFVSDTPIDFGAHITAQYGERLLEDLDDVIAAGNGTTQPEGVQNKSGVTSVNFGGATSIGSYESLMFTVAKAEVTSAAANTIVFCGTYTSYQRAMAIPVGNSDARRLSGGQSALPNYQGYTWMGRPYKINQSLTNQQIWYAVLARYRMYRRKGLTVRTSTEGDTLIRDNEMLIAVMARFGGQLERAACAALTSTAPA